MRKSSKIVVKRPTESDTGNQIRSRRIAANLTQEELAKRVGVTQAAISQWETGHSVPQSQLKKLEEVLGKLDEEDISPFSQWLAKTRVAKGLTIAELARQAKLSYLTISSIESGRTGNPQPATIEKIEKALDAKVPQEATDEAISDATIEDVGILTDFDPYDPEQRPKLPGVYVLYDISDRPIYVGKATSIADRLKAHSDKFWFRPPIVHHASFVKIEDKKLRHQVEQVLIKFLKSNAVINTQSVVRD